MATNVYGNPITNETLKGLPEYMKKVDIKAVDRATVALQMKNAEGKDVNARKFVENLQLRFDKVQSGKVTTMFLIYNATGDPVTFVNRIDWNGHLGESPCPIIIANGQWGAFLHVSVNDEQKSKGGILYQGRHAEGAAGANKFKYWVMCWQTASGSANKVYTEVRLPTEPGSLGEKTDKDIKREAMARIFHRNTEVRQTDLKEEVALPTDPSSVWKKMDEDKRSCIQHLTENEGGWLYASIGETMNPVCEVVMTLPGAVN